MCMVVHVQYVHCVIFSFVVYLIFIPWYDVNLHWDTNISFYQQYFVHREVNNGKPVLGVLIPLNLSGSVNAHEGQSSRQNICHVRNKGHELALVFHL